MRSILFILLMFCFIPPRLYSQDSSPNLNSSIKVPNGIFTDGIPQIPVEQVESIKPYSFSRFSYLQDWHPFKKEILITTQLGSVQQAHSVAMPGGMRRQLTFFDEPVYQSLFDPQKGNYIIVLKDNRGDEFFQIYRHDLSNGKTVLLSSGDKTSVSNLHWNKKGDKLLYTSRNTKTSTNQIYAVDPLNPASNQVFYNLEGPNWNLSAINN